VLKKLVGQGTLYIRLKEHCRFVVKENPNNSDIDNEDGDISQGIIPSTAATTYSSSTAISSHPNTTETITTITSSVLSSTAAPVIPTNDLIIIEDLNNPVRDIISKIKQQGIVDPTEIIRYIQNELHRGRPLFITNSYDNQADVNMIAVDRDNILQSSFDELKYVKDYQVTFEVDFIDECAKEYGGAKDYGGPRLEWIRIMNRAMKEKYFDSGLKEHLSDDYYNVGLMTGISILQGGIIPYLFKGEVHSKNGFFYFCLF